MQRHQGLGLFHPFGWNRELELRGGEQVWGQWMDWDKGRAGMRSLCPPLCRDLP